MKKALLLLVLTLGINYSYSQSDCSYGDGTFHYGVLLHIGNIPSDFDKDDFINHIVDLDEISNEDLAILNTQIISVYKTTPSYESSKHITVISSAEIDPILAELENSIDLYFCIITDCARTDGTFHYYALMINSIPNDFDKDDFISYIIIHENISNEDLTTLNTHITSVQKAFLTSQSEFLLRVLSIEATFEIYFILAELTNTLEHHECEPEPVLEINNFETAKIILYPNPTRDILVIESQENISQITIYNLQGVQVSINSFSNNNLVEIDLSNLQNGIYFVKTKTATNKVGVQRIVKR